MEENADKKEKFSKDGVQNIVALSDILKRIHIRLISEGYTIKNGGVNKSN